MKKTTLAVTQAALIAALYVVLTLLANALGLANYAIQLRFSEALTVLPFFLPAAVPGLFAGCILRGPWHPVSGQKLPRRHRQQDFQGTSLVDCPHPAHCGQHPDRAFCAGLCVSV